MRMRIGQWRRASVMIAALLWQGWLIGAGVLVGGTALAVLARVSFVVLRWALA